jgi:tRNA uridine 5-carbamoylmethylation protein Kti12
MTSEFSKPREDIVIAMRDQAVVSAVEKGFGVVIDDTNFESKHKERIRTLIKHRKQTEFVEKFFDVPLSVCLERNRNRPNPVPDQVIIDMAKRYNVGKEVNQFEKIEMDPTLKMAIIVDIDGTVAEM